MEQLVEFRRKLDDNQIIERLRNEELFKEKISEDIKKGEVYPTFRENRIDLYYYNLLFEYNENFKTHAKFAFVPKEYNTNYVTDGKEIGTVANFYDGYENIKERCRLYASKETKGVYNICKKGHVITNLKNKYIVLDTEIAFEKYVIKDNQKTKRQNRVDLLLYGLEERQLVFAEAKHFSNNEIKSSTTPKVVNQVKRYEEEIEARYDEILEIYTKYIENLNELFKESIKDPIPTPTSICPKVGLIIFGFDADQKNGKLRTEIERKIQSEDIKIYSIGKEKEINIENLYKKLR